MVSAAFPWTDKHESCYRKRCASVLELSLLRPVRGRELKTERILHKAQTSTTSGVSFPKTVSFLRDLLESVCEPRLCSIAQTAKSDRLTMSALCLDGLPESCIQGEDALMRAVLICSRLNLFLLFAALPNFRQRHYHEC